MTEFDSGYRDESRTEFDSGYRDESRTISDEVRDRAAISSDRAAVVPRVGRSGQGHPPLHPFAIDEVTRMPLPFWYLDFKDRYRREPKSDELTLDQRSSLFKCCMKNRSAAIRRSEIGIESYELIKSLERDPSLWHKFRASLDGRPESELLLRCGISEKLSKFFMRMMLEYGPDHLLEKIKNHIDIHYNSEAASDEKKYWDNILREVVGVEGDLDQMSIVFESIG